jgi:outer membrane protein assembly factor BamA
MLALILSLLCSISSPGYKLQPADTLVPRQSPAVRDTSEGRFLNIARIFITGNSRTRDQILLRELSLKPGDVVFSHDLPGIIDLDRKKLLNTRLFNTVEIRSLELEENKLDVIVEVTERWYTFPAPILELADRNFNEWWQTYDHDLRRLNYGLRLYQYNMRGRNETLRFHIQGGFTRRFELMYRFPYIDRQQKQGLSIDFNYSETKNVAFRTFNHKYEFIRDSDILRLNRGGGLSYTYRNSFYQTHAVRVEYFNSVIRDTLKELNPIYLKGESRQQKYSTISYTFNSDHRDFIAYPLKGHQVTVTATRNGLLPSDDLQRFELSFLYSKYFDLGKNFYLSNNTVAYFTDRKDLSYANYGVLGLRRQFVRGYEIYVIEGPYWGLNKTTLKKLIFSRKYHWGAMPLEQFRHIPLSIYLKTYADFGYVKNYPDYETADVNTRLSDKLLTGTGVGIDVVGSYDVVIRFEYSFNAEGENGFFFHLKREF